MICAKQEMYRLYDKGAFGNRTRYWATPEAVLADGFNGLVDLRLARGAGGGQWRGNIPVAEIADRYAEWISAGVPPQHIKIAEMAPHAHNVLQGEVMDLPDGRGLYLFASQLVGLPMRPALEQGGRSYWGLAARLLLQQSLDPSSYDWLMEMLYEIYPGHVVEFSTFSRNVGVIPHRNTCFWEVRHY